MNYHVMFAHNISIAAAGKQAEDCAYGANLHCWSILFQTQEWLRAGDVSAPALLKSTTRKLPLCTCELFIGDGLTFWGGESPCQGEISFGRGPSRDPIINLPVIGCIVIVIVARISQSDDSHNRKASREQSLFPKRKLCRPSTSCRGTSLVARSYMQTKLRIMSAMHERVIGIVGGFLQSLTYGKSI